MPRTVTPQTIGERIETARELRGIKPVRLAADLDIHPDTLLRYEKGTTEPTYRTLVQISRLLNVPVGYFAGEEAIA